MHVWLGVGDFFNDPWVHKTANVLNKPPNSQQPKAKRALQEIWMAETKKDALAAFDAFRRDLGRQI
jgi:hypothetical protein